MSTILTIPPFRTPILQKQQRLHLPPVSFLYIFLPVLRRYLASLPSVLHVLPMLSALIQQSAYREARSTNYEDPHYVIFLNFDWDVRPQTPS